MSPIKPIRFIERISILTTKISIIYKIPFARIGAKRKKRHHHYGIIKDDAIIDLHCHPSLKMYLLNMHIWKKHRPRPGENWFVLQDDFTQLSYGNIKGMLVAHYLVEAAAEREWDLLKYLYPFLSRIFYRTAAKIENEDPTNFDQVNTMINVLEEQVQKLNNKQQKIELVIAKDFKHFKRVIADKENNKIAIAHAIEGAHSLGRNFPISQKRTDNLERSNPAAFARKKQAASIYDDDPSYPYIQNLHALKERGLCLITLAHLFKNDLAYPCEGLSVTDKRTLLMNWEYTPCKDYPLTAIGKAVAAEMLRIGVIVDLTHSTPAARKEVFELNREETKRRHLLGKKSRPLTFTHTGAQHVFTKYDQGKFENFKYYSVSDEEIHCISECDGVIGILPETFWLVGANTHLKEDGFDPAKFRDGIKYMIETMIYINSKTIKKDFSNIAIGTDFDGLVDDPEDFYKAEQIPHLVTAMKKNLEIGAKNVPKILHENAMRLLEYGWGD